MKKNKFNILIIRIFVVLCAMGITSTSISIGKLYIFESEIESFYSLPLDEGKEYSPDILIRKIKSIENIDKAKSKVYSKILSVIKNSLIVSCFLFHLLFLFFIYTNYKKQKHESSKTLPLK